PGGGGGSAATERSPIAAPSRPGRCRPHPSQTPPCGFPAVGFSGDSPRPRVSDPGTQQRMPPQQLLVARPREGLATCAPVEPMPPDAPGALKELIQTVVVRRATVVLVVAP